MEEAKSWDWNNLKTLRVIDGRYVKSWHNIVEIINYKAKKGYREVEIREGPLFMLISGETKTTE